MGRCTILLTNGINRSRTNFVVYKNNITLSVENRFDLEGKNVQIYLIQIRKLKNFQCGLPKSNLIH